MSTALPPSVGNLIGRTLDDVTVDSLQALIGIKEGDATEWKSELYSNQELEKRKLAGAVAAFSNLSGGLLVLGAEEDGQARCTALPGVPAPDHDEELRVRQHVFETVTPHPAQIEIRTLEIAGNRRIYLIHVPRSTLAPHAVRYGDRLRYVLRNGQSTRVLSESEVADRYRRRFREDSDRADQLRRVLEQGLPRLSPSEMWIAMCVLPEVESLHTMSGEFVERVAVEAKTRVTHGMPQGSLIQNGTLHPRAAVRRVVLDANYRDPAQYFTAELHLTGAGFAALYFGEQAGAPRNFSWLVDPPDGAQPWGVLEAAVVDRIVDLLGFLGGHAAMTGGAGDLRVAVRVVQPQLLRAATALVDAGMAPFADMYHHSRWAESFEDVDFTVALDDVASVSPRLLQSARMAICDVLANFAVAEPRHISMDGALNLAEYLPGARPALQVWANEHGIAWG